MTATKGKPFEPMIPAPAEIELSPNGRQVLERRYLRRGLDGKPAETIEEMFRRVARAVAAPDAAYGYDVQSTEDAFYGLLTSRRFFPNSPTFTGAGTPLGQLAACFVLPISDDLGKQSDGIFQTLRDAALIQQTGGGNGFSFSRLRPKGDKVASSAGVATGPVGFLRVYDTAFGEVAQGGCLLPETLVFTSQGLLRLDEIANTETPGWQEHHLEVATDQGWRVSPRSFNNGVAPILRVHTRQGLSLAGTFEHRVKVMTDNGPEWRQLQELRKGDWILVQMGQQRGTLQALRQPARVHGNQNWPAMPAILDEELAFFLGYLTGDGFVAAQEGDNRVGVSISQESYLMKEMPALLERLFGITANRQQKKQDRSVTLVLDNRAVKEFLQINGLAKGRSRQASIPRLIRQSPPNVVGAYLRGLFEADGGLSHGYPYLTTTSPRLAEEVATLLIGLGCPVRVRSIAPGANHYGSASIYHIRIESTHGLEAWREKIGCDPRSRFAVCMAWESDLRRESTYILPKPHYWLWPVLDAITLEQVDRRQRGLGRKFRSSNPDLRRSLLRYLRDERNFTMSAFEVLASQHPEFAEHAIDPSDLWFVQVAGVEPTGESLTLDLEVEGNHTYLAYGMVTHNTRRGANMAVLRVDHPDIEEFITCKAQEGQIANFNISVGITDAFMRAVEEDADFPLVNPRDGTVWRTVRARALFDKMVTFAHHNGEPGALFLDAANRSNPVPHLYELEATNPCGEQWLGSYENCCLGSINLAQHVTADGRVDWDKLRESTIVATRFLDNVVDANKYVPAVPQLREAALRARRIGLGIMGLGDIMYALGVRYGSEEGQEFAAQIMEFVRYHCMLTSIELARERGPFPAIQGSIYDPNDLKWRPPTPLTPYRRDWGRPAVDWEQVVAGIRQHGIRNAAQTTVAPTGTIGTVTGCEGYGCEPVFALAYTRTVKDGDKDLKLTYTSPLFEKALREAGLDEATRQRISEQVSVTGSCQDVLEVPEAIRRVFVVASDITAEEHVRMQAAIQAFVDNSISKCVVGHTLLLTDQGLAPIETLSDLRLPDQFAPLACNVLTPKGVEPATLFYYGGHRETRKVTLEYGFEIEGTPNHRIHVLTQEGEIAFRRLDELRPGDVVVLYSGQQQFGRPASLLPPFSGRFRTNSHRLTFPERMSTELAFLLGCITSEGAITVNGVTISSTDVALLEQLQGIARSLFGLDSYIASDTRNQVRYLQLNSRALRDWLLTDLDLQAGAEHKVIPPCILRASQEEIAAFLRGLFLDGFMTQNGKLFGITLASRRLIAQLQVLLLNAGIVATTRQVGERAYSLTVQGGELERLADWIGFVEVWKNERIERRNLGRLQRYRNYSRLLPKMVTDALAEMKSQAYETLHRAGGRQDFADRFLAYDDEQKVYASVEKVEAGFAEVFDISVPESHVFVANGFANHNTINFPSTATVEDVAAAYKLAWKLGCKGLTVYVAGSRQEVVLETKAISAQKEKGAPAAEGQRPATAEPRPASVPAEPAYPAQRRPRPAALPGMTYRKETPLGTAYITVNVNGHGQPFEVFLNVGKAGSDVASVSEALGRLISLVLRLPSPLEPLERLKLIIDQLAGIGGGRTLGFGAHRVRSLPDAIAQVLREHLNGHFEALGQMAEASEPAAGQLALPIADRPIGDLCPDCGQATFIATEGCRKCYVCGYSEC